MGSVDLTGDPPAFVKIKCACSLVCRQHLTGYCGFDQARGNKVFLRLMDVLMFSEFIVWVYCLNKHAIESKLFGMCQQKTFGFLGRQQHKKTIHFHSHSNRAFNI